MAIDYYWHDPRVEANYREFKSRGREDDFTLPIEGLRKWVPGLCIANGMKEHEATVKTVTTQMIIHAHTRTHAHRTHAHTPHSRSHKMPELQLHNAEKGVVLMRFTVRSRDEA